MPRKTKKQKIIAAYRQKLAALETGKKILPRAQTIPTVPIRAPHPTISESDIEYEKQLKQTTMKDLKKTLIIGNLLLALEFFIFYANLKGVL